MKDEFKSSLSRPSRRFARYGCRSRSGAATVELALCLPVVIVLAFGMMETCNMVFVRTRMISAAYEACRLATRPTTSNQTAATSSQVIAYCNTLLTQLGVNGASVSLSPASLTNVTPLTPVTLTVTAPLSSNAISSYVLRNAMTLTVNVTLIIE